MSFEIKAPSFRQIGRLRVTGLERPPDSAFSVCTFLFFQLQFTPPTSFLRSLTNGVENRSFGLDLEAWKFFGLVFRPFTTWHTMKLASCSCSCCPQRTADSHGRWHRGPATLQLCWTPAPLHRPACRAGHRCVALPVAPSVQGCMRSLAVCKQVVRRS